MLPPLPDVDLLECVPDVCGISLWDHQFSWSLIPAQVGCYAFYDADTNDVVYIGSACVNSDSPSNVGLRHRLRFYKGRGKAERPTATIRKVRDYAAKHRLLLRCWVIASPGDCRKFEEDTIRKHKPRLNWIGTRTLSAEQHRARRANWARRRLARLRQENQNGGYDPERVRLCTSCETSKPCGMFRRNASKLYGVVAVCKQCARERRHKA